MLDKSQRMKEFIERRTRSAASQYDSSHWMRTDVQSRLPQASNDFDNNRDPAIPLQKAAMQLSEAQRRRQSIYGAMHQSKSEGRGSAMVKKERPAPALRPPAPMRIGPDRAAFSQSWMNERMSALSALKHDRQKLQQSKEGLKEMYAQTQKPALPQDKHREAEREFYVQKRQAERIMDRSQQHVQKFNRVIKR